MRSVRDAPLRGGDWIIDARYGVVDIAMPGWLRHLIGFHGAGDRVQFDRDANVATWLKRGPVHPVVGRGLEIPRRGEASLIYNRRVTATFSFCTFQQIAGCGAPWTGTARPDDSDRVRNTSVTRPLSEAVQQLTITSAS